MLTLFALVLSACPAEQQPGWAAADPAQKRAMVRSCAPADELPANVQPWPKPEPFHGTSPFKFGLGLISSAHKNSLSVGPSARGLLTFPMPITLSLEVSAGLFAIGDVFDTSFSAGYSFHPQDWLVRPYLGAGAGLYDELRLFTPWAQSKFARATAGVEVVVPGQVFALGLEVGFTKPFAGADAELPAAPGIRALITWYLR